MYFPPKTSLDYNPLQPIYPSKQGNNPKKAPPVHLEKEQREEEGKKNKEEEVIGEEGQYSSSPKCAPESFGFICLMNLNKQFNICHSGVTQYRVHFHYSAMIQLTSTTPRSLFSPKAFHTPAEPSTTLFPHGGRPACSESHPFTESHSSTTFAATLLR